MEQQQISEYSILTSLAAALLNELQQLQTAMKTLKFFSGVKIDQKEGSHWYRFEIPEDIWLEGVEHAIFSFGNENPLTIPGRIVSLDNQYLTIALPFDLGTIIPETHCAWNVEQHLKPVVTLLGNLKEIPPVLTSLFRPTDDANVFQSNIEPSFPPDTSQSLQQAVRGALQKRVSFAWGPARSGKTSLIAACAANYLKANKKILIIADDREDLDDCLALTIEYAQKIGVDAVPLSVTLGTPPNLEEISRPYPVLKTPIEAFREYTLCRTKEIINQDFFERLAEYRKKIDEKSAQIEDMNNEITSFKNQITKIQNASVLEKMKKEFSKESLAAAQQKLNEKLAMQKRLQALQQSLMSDLSKAEAFSPLSKKEIETLDVSAKRIAHFGGLEKIHALIEETVQLYEQNVIESKQLVCATASTMMANQHFRDQMYDVILIENAEAISLPALGALSLQANEQLIVAGDPFQIELETYSKSAIANEWLKKDIFSLIAGMDDINQITEFLLNNPQCCLKLTPDTLDRLPLSYLFLPEMYRQEFGNLPADDIKGRIFFFDTSSMDAGCKQYLGKKKMLPYNEVHAKKTVECVKDALVEGNHTAGEIAVILPLLGQTLYTKQQLRMHGLTPVEVGTPHNFRSKQRRAVIFDTVASNLDYTMRLLDDKKAGETTLRRMFNTILSCAGEDLYVIADMSHFEKMYKGRLVLKLLARLKELSESEPSLYNSSKKFDSLDWHERKPYFERNKKKTVKSPVALPSAGKEKSKEDVELAMRMKMIKKSKETQPQQAVARSYEREIYQSVVRVQGMVADLNLLAQYIGADLLFRRTLSVEQLSEKLPHDSCKNEKEFSDLMQKWNLVVYEMSGGDHTDLSFFGKNTPEARIRYDINNLKVYYSSEFQAVIEEGRKKIAMMVARVFQELLGKTQPANPNEWSTAYLNFLSRLESYLAWISSEIRK
jgi:hypothetical protein